MPRLRGVVGRREEGVVTNDPISEDNHLANYWREVACIALAEAKTMRETLTAAQARATSLLEEARALRCCQR